MKFYITTAIDYVNAKPHIGHALEKVQADVLARYHRAKGDEVWFLTGVDIHGVKNLRAAEAAGKTPEDFTAENSVFFKNLKDILNLSWDDFISTGEQDRHWRGVQKLWRRIYEAGDLYKKNYRGLYCVGCEVFITEKELIDGKCPIHQKPPEIVDQENWFFRLSKYAGEIGSKIKSGELKITPESRKNEILSFIQSGLEDVSFSRPKKDLPWGVPVPNDSEQVMYVWCDALSNYITAIGYADEPSGKRQATQLRPSYANGYGVAKQGFAGQARFKFHDLWPADLQVIGKDILRFHAAIWPGMLISASLPLPKSLFVHGFITVDGQKMSKTLGNIIDPAELVKKYGTDAVRYYLLREISAYEDGDFGKQKFEDRYNADLANGLGNLVSRVATLGEKISPIGFDFGKDIEDLIKKECGRIFSDYEKNMNEIKLNDVLASLWELISVADKYINEKKPWKTTDQNELKKIVANSCYLIGVISNLVSPFIPATAEKIGEQISYSESAFKIKKGATLFPRSDTKNTSFTQIYE